MLCGASVQFGSVRSDSATSLSTCDERMRPFAFKFGVSLVRNWSVPMLADYVGGVIDDSEFEFDSGFRFSDFSCFVSPLPLPLPFENMSASDSFNMMQQHDRV